jgi:hypothetical protein
MATNEEVTRASMSSASSSCALSVTPDAGRDRMLAATSSRCCLDCHGCDAAWDNLPSQEELYPPSPVLTEVAVKLHPIPDVERTLVLRTTDAAEAARFVTTLRTAPVTPIVELNSAAPVTFKVPATRVFPVLAATVNLVVLIAMSEVEPPVMFEPTPLQALCV